MSVYVWDFRLSCHDCDDCCHVWSQGDIRISVSMCEICDSDPLTVKTVAIFEVRGISGYQFLCVGFRTYRIGSTCKGPINSIWMVRVIQRVLLVLGKLSKRLIQKSNLVFENGYFKLWSLIQNLVPLNWFIRQCTTCFPCAVWHCVDDSAAFFGAL
jgi:hypothetical protein